MFNAVALSQLSHVKDADETTSVSATSSTLPAPTPSRFSVAHARKDRPSDFEELLQPARCHVFHKPFDGNLYECAKQVCTLVGQHMASNSTVCRVGG